MAKFLRSLLADTVHAAPRVNVPKQDVNSKTQQKLDRLSALKTDLAQNPSVIVHDTSEFLGGLHDRHRELFPHSPSLIEERMNTIFSSELFGAKQGPRTPMGAALKATDTNVYQLADQFYEQVEQFVNENLADQPNLRDAILKRERKELSKVGPFQAGFTEHLQSATSSYFRPKFAPSPAIDKLISYAVDRVTADLVNGFDKDPLWQQTVAESFNVFPVGCIRWDEDKKHLVYSQHGSELYRKWRSTSYQVTRHNTNSGFPYATSKDGWGSVPETLDEVVSMMTDNILADRPITYNPKPWCHAVLSLALDHNHSEWGPSIVFQRAVPGGRLPSTITPDTPLTWKLRRVMATALPEKILGKPFSSLLLKSFLTTPWGVCYQAESEFEPKVRRSINSSHISIGSDFSAFDQSCGEYARSKVFEVIARYVSHVGDVLYDAEEDSDCRVHNMLLASHILTLLEQGYSNTPVWLPYGIATASKDGEVGLFSGFSLTSPIGTIWNAIFSYAFAAINDLKHPIHLDEGVTLPREWPDLHYRYTVNSTTHASKFFCVGDDGLVCFNVANEPHVNSAHLEHDSKVLAQRMATFAGELSMTMSADKQEIMFAADEDLCKVLNSPFQGYVTFLQKCYAGCYDGVSNAIYPLLRAFPRLVWDDPVKDEMAEIFKDEFTSNAIIAESNLGFLATLHVSDCHPAQGLLIGLVAQFLPGHLDPRRTVNLSRAQRAIAQGHEPSAILDWPCMDLITRLHLRCQPIEVLLTDWLDSPTFFDNEFDPVGYLVNLAETQIRHHLTDSQIVRYLTSSGKYDVRHDLSDSQRKAVKDKNQQTSRNELVTYATELQRKKQVYLTEEQVARLLSGVRRVVWTDDQLKLMSTQAPRTVDHDLLNGQPSAAYRDEAFSARDKHTIAEIARSLVSSASGFLGGIVFPVPDSNKPRIVSDFADSNKGFSDPIYTVCRAWSLEETELGSSRWYEEELF